MKENEYDVIIIGAGIGGLTSGCYLAKNGLKTLLVERKSKPGGFCNSFTAKGFYFDGCVHSLGDLSPDGAFFEILNELNLFDKLNLIRHNPIDKIFSPNHEVTFYNNVNDTIASIAQAFPNEKENFINFLDLVLETDELKIISKLRSKTFLNVLDSFFVDKYFKQMLSLPTFGNIGVPAEYLNAFTAIKHYKSFLIDGGHYPTGGIQDLSDKLLERFEQYGGSFMRSKYVKKVFLRNNIAEGVQLNDDGIYNGKYMISACDSRHTFLDLVGEDNLDKGIVAKLNKMIPSVSLVIGYLGFKNDYRMPFTDNCNCWYLYDDQYDLNCMGSLDNNRTNLRVKWLMILPKHVNKTALIFTSAPYANKCFWEQNKNKFMDLILCKLETKISGINSALKLKMCATPHSLENWTTSSYGAPYGWAYTVDQFMDPDFTRDAIVRNLFLSSHWNTITSGVSGVAITGRRVARIIISRKSNKEF
jgi:prolycopene isomerase